MAARNGALQSLCRASLEGHLAAHLRAHPEQIVPEVAAALEDDTSRALEFGDLEAASASAAAAAAIWFALDDAAASAAVLRQITLARAAVADSSDEVAELREWALAAAARSQDAGEVDETQDHWLFGLEAEARLVREQRPGSRRPARLLDLLRGMADLGDHLYDTGGQGWYPGHLVRYIDLLVFAVERALDEEWPADHTLLVRAALRRLSRRGRPVLRAALSANVTLNDRSAQRVDWLEQTLRMIAG